MVLSRVHMLPATSRPHSEPASPCSSTGGSSTFSFATEAVVPFVPDAAPPAEHLKHLQLRVFATAFALPLTLAAGTAAEAGARRAFDEALPPFLVRLCSGDKAMREDAAALQALEAAAR